MNAYLGYAQQQFQRLDRRGDGSFSSDTRKRTAKHARHLMRLCRQGYELYTTGRLDVREAARQREHEVAPRPHELGVAAVRRPAGELGVRAQVLEAAAAGGAGAVRSVEPGHADALAGAGDPAGHLVAEHHGPASQ